MFLRFIGAFTVLLFLGLPVTSLSSSGSCGQNELKIVGRNEDGTGFRYRLNDVLRIEASGDCLEYINTVLKKNNTIRDPLMLYLDGVRMDSLPVIPESQKGDLQRTNLTLGVQLKRISENEESKKNWDEFLGRQSSGYIMKPKVGLSIDGGIPLTIIISDKLRPNDSEFQFYIAEEKWVWMLGGFGGLVFFTVFYLLIQNPTALRDDKSELYSLGKSQMAFWGLLVIISFSCIWCLTGMTEKIPDQILMLMGISGATALSSIVISDNKKAVIVADKKKDLATLEETQRHLMELKIKATGGNLQDIEKRSDYVDEKINLLFKATIPLKSRGFFRDICDGGHGMSFHRLQAVLWTVILGIIFVMSITTKISMPEFPKNLLLLLGVSNLTYIGFKFPNEKKATITKEEL